MKRLKVNVFIEGSNIYFAQKKMSKWLDWVKVKQYLDKLYSDPKVEPFLRKLKKIGFRVIRKSVKIIIDEAGRAIEKANFDVEITSDILELVNNIEAVVLFSGDSDFDYLARVLHKKGKQLFVYSSKKTLSWELKLSASKYFLLENFPDLTKGKQFVKL